ncbi:hypothetical protein DPMN_087696 [Dreissena polymorpha]|uniref:Uncharacterized protein n=1 Tax=Dreissena polymorpha TaxID=45954 RepID=A0A9D4QVR3_DREPO|nr:hypothetical protein DPMN_087696 [Dreissena polymorpha]
MGGWSRGPGYRASSRGLVAGMSRSGPMGPFGSAWARGCPAEHGGRASYPAGAIASEGLLSADNISVAAISVYRKGRQSR